MKPSHIVCIAAGALGMGGAVVAITDPAALGVGVVLFLAGLGLLFAGEHLAEGERA